MPIFEFKCSACGSEFEKLVKNSESTAECPSCHSTDLQKKLSTFSAISKSAFATAGSSALESMPVGPCGSCGNPNGPGSCQFD